MKLKIFIICCFALGYLMLSFASNASSPVCGSIKLSICETAIDGTKPPHAVDVSGKVIPESSAIQPDKPIILAKDSLDSSKGALKPDAAFDHVKHSTQLSYSLDGKTVTACIECHHTDQHSAPKGQEYLKRFDRKEPLTAKQLEASKQPVSSCRACHFQESTEPTDEFPPQEVTYPKKSGKQPTGTLTNDVAYHINCNSCHDAAKTRDPKLKAPQRCFDCHTKQQ
ncbi:MAG: cytochrome c3 family protein [Acidobacteria bacterium]|nr:cytochrome c3 family protein [Acidobacteriota bacterium]